MILNVDLTSLTTEQREFLNNFMDSLPYDPRAPQPLPIIASDHKRPWTAEEILAREG